jgi:hypothetical protein
MKLFQEVKRLYDLGSPSKLRLALFLAKTHKYFGNNNESKKLVLGGYASSRVSQKYRLFNAGVIGSIHIFWLYYMTKSFNITNLLLIPLAILGGFLAVKAKPIVEENEQV